MLYIDTGTLVLVTNNSRVTGKIRGMDYDYMWAVGLQNWTQQSGYRLGGYCGCMGRCLDVMRM